MDQAIIQCLEGLGSKHPEHQERLERMKENYRKRMWYLLTDQLLEYVNLPLFKNPGNTDLLPFYDSIIKNLNIRISQTKFVQLAYRCALQMKVEEQLAFLQNIEKDIKEKEAKILIRIYEGYGYMRVDDKQNLLDIIEETAKAVEGLHDLDTVIYSEFYRLQALYYLKKEDLEEYYKNGLQFLSYTKESDLSKTEQQEWSRNMAIAVMVGKNIYNIGELLEKKILRSLLNTPHAWLLELIETFNGGQIKEYKSKVAEYDKKFAAQPLLKQNQDQIYQKVCILSFMELIFQREKGDRNLPFKLIGDELGFAEDDIEYLVMKAMSLGLVKGTIDQIDKVIRVSWVKPRILDMDRIVLMRDKLQQWQDGLEAITHMLEDKAQDLLAGQ